MIQTGMDLQTANGNAADAAMDVTALIKALSHLSDREIEGLEDDLNFFAFTGITSARIESVLDRAGMGPAAKVANSNEERLALVGRVLSALFDTAAIVLVFALGRLLYGTAAGVLAAVFVTLTVMHIQQAHFATVDATLAFFAIAVFHDPALEETRGCRHHRVPLFRLFLVAHAEVAARALEVHHVFVFRPSGSLGGIVVKFEA